MRFSYGSDITDPAKLFLALQADDGSWHALFPLRIDRANRTISAELPLPTASFKRPAAPARPYRIVRWLEEFYIQPNYANVKVGQTVTLIPYALGLSPNERPPLPCAEGEDCLQWLPQVRTSVPFTNDKPGYLRVWYVNNALEGDATIGTIRPNRGIGAVYTAPARKPEPSTVTVEFISTDQHNAREASATATIQIVADDEWVGTIRFSGEGTLTEVIDEPSHGCAPYISCTYHSEETTSVSISGSVQFAGRAPFPDSASLEATAVSAQSMESFTETVHQTFTRPSGCVETTDIRGSESISGSMNQLSMNFPLFAVLSISNGQYMIVATAPFWETTGVFEEHSDFFDCVNGANQIDSELPRTSSSGVPFGIIEGTIDPAHPKELRGSKTFAEMDGDVVVAYTLSWDFTRP